MSESIVHQIITQRELKGPEFSLQSHSPPLNDLLIRFADHLYKEYCKHGAHPVSETGEKTCELVATNRHKLCLSYMCLHQLYQHLLFISFNPIAINYLSYLWCTSLHFDYIASQ